jgi:hypothetical protein
MNRGCTLKWASAARILQERATLIRAIDRMILRVRQMQTARERISCLNFVLTTRYPPRNTRKASKVRGHR